MDEYVFKAIIRAPEVTPWLLVCIAALAEGRVPDALGALNLAHQAWNTGTTRMGRTQ